LSTKFFLVARTQAMHANSKIPCNILKSSIFEGLTATGRPLKCRALEDRGKALPGFSQASRWNIVKSCRTQIQLPLKMQILHKVRKIHHCGFRHTDTDEHHVVGQNDFFRVIDLYNIEEYVCDFAGFFLRAYGPLSCVTTSQQRGPHGHFSPPTERLECRGR
jgi:hypothetical protein